MNITVPAGLFTSALAAAAAHTFQGKDAGYLATVDLQMTDDLNLVATASGGSTTGVALVPLVETDGDMSRVALSKQDISTIRSLFNNPLKQLDVTVRSKTVSPDNPDDKPEIIHQMDIRELGGLFGGQQLKLTMPDHGHRDVAGLWHPISTALNRRTMSNLPVTLFHPKDMARFRAAATAYGEELRIEPADSFGSLLVHCSHYFVGFMAANAQITDMFTKSRTQWSERLPMKINLVRDGS